MEFLDSKTNEKHEAELYPIAHENELRVHYIWPHVLKNPERAKKFTQVRSFRTIKKTR